MKKKIFIHSCRPLISCQETTTHACLHHLWPQSNTTTTTANSPFKQNMGLIWVPLPLGKRYTGLVGLCMYISSIYGLFHLRNNASFFSLSSLRRQFFCFCLDEGELFTGVWVATHASISVTVWSCTELIKELVYISATNQKTEDNLLSFAVHMNMILVSQIDPCYYNR